MRRKPKMIWESPPPRSTERYNWSAIADVLRSHPGEWAKVFDEDLTSLATAVRNSDIKALTRYKGFEVRTSNNKRDPVRTCTLFLRYNPEKDQEKDQEKKS